MSVLTPLPCPFCSDPDPAIDEVETKVWALVCNGCGCTGPIEDYDNAKQSPERAVELWNQRGGDDQPESATIPVMAVPFGNGRKDSCKECNEAALFAASKTLPEWRHMLRAKALLLDLIAWYDNGKRDVKDLDRIYDATTDLFPGR